MSASDGAAETNSSDASCKVLSSGGNETRQRQLESREFGNSRDERCFYFYAHTVTAGQAIRLR